MKESLYAVIKRQEEGEKFVALLFDKMQQAEERLADFYLQDPVFIELFSKLENKNEEELTTYLIEETKDIKTTPNYKKSQTLVAELTKAELKYYYSLYNYIQMIDNDRKTLFTSQYMAAINKSADRGYMLFFQRTPDYPLALLQKNDWESHLIEYFSNGLDVIFSEILDKNRVPSTDLEKRKTNTLRDALASFKEKRYDACAKELFALLENDYTNADNVSGKFRRGHEKDKNIKRKLDDLGYEYFINGFNKISSFYKRITVTTDKWDKVEINRHALVHGTYERETTKKDCIKLFSMFISFKELTYLIQRIDDLLANLERMAILAKKNENFKNN